MINEVPCTLNRIFMGKSEHFAAAIVESANENVALLDSLASIDMSQINPFDVIVPSA